MPLPAAPSIPMEFKKRLALEILRQFHDAEAANDAAAAFERTFQRGELPGEIKEVDLRNLMPDETPRLSTVLVQANLARSSSDGARLIKQGSVQVNEVAVPGDTVYLPLKAGDVIRIGRRRFARVLR